MGRTAKASSPLSVTLASCLSVCRVSECPRRQSAQREIYVLAVYPAESWALFSWALRVRAHELSIRPSVRLSVCLSVRNVEVSWSYRLEFLENNFTAY